MTLLADARMYARFAVGLRRFLRQRLTPGEAEAIIADRLARRESNFFRLLERGIYGYTAHTRTGPRRGMEPIAASYCANGSS